MGSQSRPDRGGSRQRNGRRAEPGKGCLGCTHPGSVIGDRLSETNLITREATRHVRHLDHLDASARRRSADPDSRAVRQGPVVREPRSEEHTSELQSLMRLSYAVFCLKKPRCHKHTPTTPPPCQLSTAAKPSYPT